MANREPAHSTIQMAAGDDSENFAELMNVPVGEQSVPRTEPIGGIVVGRLVGLIKSGAIPVVTYTGQPGPSPIAARTTIDLHAPHVGRNVVLVFESGDPSRPIVTGCIREADDLPVPELSGHVELESDGERLVVSAVHGLVLRCGKASITLSPEGKIVVRGTQVVSHASGLNRIKGGSVQVN